MARKKYEEVLANISSYYEDKVRDDPAGVLEKLAWQICLLRKRGVARTSAGRKPNRGRKELQRHKGKRPC
jgi:hypothetical protein